MQLDVRKYLFDISRAAGRISRFTANKTLQDYLDDPMLQSAVERQFEIIGEAVGQPAKVDPAISARISDHRRLVNFRNILIHGYAEVDPRLVWDLLQSMLPILASEVVDLYEEK
jgi:uncharacterized protein with HEPN domain